MVEGMVAGAVRIKLSDYALGTLIGAVVLVFIVLTYFVRHWFSRQGA